MYIAHCTDTIHNQKAGSTELSVLQKIPKGYSTDITRYLRLRKKYPKWCQSAKKKKWIDKRTMQYQLSSKETVIITHIYSVTAKNYGIGASY
jgi:hypothetical protein